MIIFDNYKIEKITKSDVLDIYQLMVSNTERFQRFFPKTLEANLTLVSAQVFATQKVKAFDASEEFLFTIKKEDKVVGLVYIKELDWKKKQGEFAYCLDKNCESKGVMTEAVKRLSTYAFDTLGLEVLQIIVHISNLGSAKVAKKCNFTWQKTLLKVHTPPNEDPLDMELYELTKPL
ncbi:MAG TPA: N-acetyltransferase [Flavobacteriia bacterium]|jgi:ribosomal-protein-alanine N-acetyltransferase|nr:N-acetyltransferase [Flavobacteriia bacterium]